MLLPIDDSNRGQALDLLCQGYPERTKRFWEIGLERLSNSSGNTQAAVPIGYLMMANVRPVGVMLTPASVRKHDDRQVQKIINLSSWYIEPGHRAQALPMLQSILQDDDAIFTDLTPTLAVQRILLAFGFRPLNRGGTVNLAPIISMRKSACSRLVDLDGIAQTDIGRETHALLLSQHNYGCFSAAFTLDGVVHPLQFKARRWRGIPAADLVYCESNKVVLANISAIGSYLIRRGKLLLFMDVPLEGEVVGFKRRNGGIGFAKGGKFGDRTDHIGSELTLFDW